MLHVSALKDYHQALKYMIQNIYTRIYLCFKSRTSVPGEGP